MSEEIKNQICGASAGHQEGELAVAADILGLQRLSRMLVTGQTDLLFPRQRSIGSQWWLMLIVNITGSELLRCQSPEPVFEEISRVVT